MKIVDLTGRTFGSLTVIRESGPSRDGRPMYRCACACGKETVVQRSNLITGNTTSCGCRRRKAVSEAQRKRWQRYEEALSNRLVVKGVLP